MRIDVASARRLRVADELVVVDAWKRRLQSRCSAGFARRIAFTRAMNSAQAVGASQIPVAQLVFLRVQVFLAARLARRVLQQLEAGP